MKRKITLLLLIFILIMTVVTACGEKLRNYTSPTVAAVPFDGKIPNSAFIDGSSFIYVIMEQNGILGSEQYIKSIEVQKESTQDHITYVRNISVPDALIVVGADRPLKDLASVKTAGRYYKPFIPSQYRDTLAVETRLSHDQLAGLVEYIKLNSLVTDIRHDETTQEDESAIMYVKAEKDCSELLEDQLKSYFEKNDNVRIINIELYFRKIEAVIMLMLCFMLACLLLFVIRKLLKRNNELKKKLHQERQLYYFNMIVRRNISGLCMEISLAAIAALILIVLLNTIPLPPMPAYLIPEKLIHIRQFISNIREYQASVKNSPAFQAGIVQNLDTAYRVSIYSFIMLIFITVSAYTFLKLYRKKLKKGIQG